VANRTRIAEGKTPLAVEQRLLRLVPKEFLQDAHHWLILHGRYVCTARKPRCPECSIADLCEYKHKTAALVPGDAPPAGADRSRDGAATGGDEKPPLDATS
jgi:endonuclease-3